ncbi:hypothetical protein X743_31265 [Mesorhizobium sp. LNHC252B00]|uniref:hypothetical protein n=1 Tax=Mesorhizobium sp. LNHC252B00 TaxID=1287252 RepID=UPI0003CE23E0|nr:hypothetical protein [Mesorhizobium sp. LNHC252B00]ESY64349.1 hypothetical protein X743_31265 [Mesorhizobium sp. LNHC252B00]
MFDAVAIDDPPDRGDGSGLSRRRVGRFADDPDVKFLAKRFHARIDDHAGEDIARKRVCPCQHAAPRLEHDIA